MSEENPSTNLIARQFAQTLSVLAWFQAHPRGSFMRASRDLGMSAAQIQHELKQLSMCGLPGYYPGSLVEIAMDRTTAEAQFTAGLDGPLRLTTVEAGVLLLNLETIRDAVPAEQREAVDSVATKLRELTGRGAPSGAKGSSASSSGRQSATTAPLDRTVEALREATRQRRIVRCEYLSLGRDERRPRRLVPDALRMVEGNAYLLAREQSPDGEVAAEQKNFRVSRMSSVELDKEGSAPKAVSTAVDAQDPFDFGATDRWAQFTLRDSALWMLEYFPLWVEQDSADPEQGADEDTEPGVDEDAEPGGTSVTIPDTGAWLERFLIAYAANIAELSTPDVARRVARRAEAGLAVYRDRFPDVS